MKIIVSLYSKPLKTGAKSPKDYPYAQQLVDLLVKNGHEVIQVAYGAEPVLTSVTELRNAKLREIEDMLKTCDTYICVDTYLQHMAHYLGIRGIVIFAMSNPEYFGYPDNINIVKDNKYFKTQQFQPWDMIQANDEAFVEPSVVVEAVNKFRIRNTV